MAVAFGICAAVLVGGAGWMFVALVERNGRLLARVGALEQSLRWRWIPGETAAARRARLFQGFSAGNRFEVDNILRDIVERDEYGIGDLEFDAEDVVVDVGAHIGVFSYLCYVQGSRAVYAYEPGARNFGLLTRNAGSLPGVHVFQKAVWRSDGDSEATLFLAAAVDDNTGSHTVLAQRHVDFRSQALCSTGAAAAPVAAVSLDEILAGFGRVKLLKLDCEGSEFPILLTSRQLEKVERIVAEVHEIGEEAMGLLEPQSRVPGYNAYRVQDLTARLEASGFEVETRAGDRHMYWLTARRP